MPIDWENGIVGAVPGSLVSGGGALAARYLTTKLDFIQRPLHDVSVGTSFVHLGARASASGPNGAMVVNLVNHSGASLYIARAVYFPPDRTLLPLFNQARRSQKYPKGLELLFGTGDKHMDCLIPSNEEVNIQIPLKVEKNMGLITDVFELAKYVEVGHRGTLLLEYVTGGRPGVYKAKL